MGLRILAYMAERTPGERAAVRAALARMIELEITTQADLAERAGVSLRTVQGFLNYEHWPRNTTLGKIERLGLNWVAGYLREIRDRHDAALEKQGVSDIRELAENTREQLLSDLQKWLQQETSQDVKDDLRSS